jgi:ferredoxin
MASGGPRLLLCDCEGSMPVAADGLGKILSELGLGPARFHRNLCRSETAAFEKALADPSALCVACTQEAPLFAEIAAESERDDLTFFDLRESAGWSAESAKSLPKMAALVAAATTPAVPARLRTVESDGFCLVIGAGQAAFEAAARLDRSLSVSLLLTDAEDLVLPTTRDFPVFTGRVVAARGSFGAFEVTIDGHAALSPSARASAVFGLPRNGVRTTCSVVFDMTGDAPLFAGDHGRDGYVRADPGDRAAVLEAIATASDLVGSFEKPIYVGVDAAICAHSRSRKVGCSKCLDHCPASAITPNGDSVVIDPGICDGCGNCAAHCPTGAISYAYPSRADLITRVQAVARTYLAAGGDAPVLLLHDAKHGTPLIGAMARYGRGLPAAVVPLELHSTSGIGHDLLAAAFAVGFRTIVILSDPARAEEMGTVAAEVDLLETLVAGFGHAGPRVVTLLESDPDLVEASLYELPARAEITRAGPSPVGSKREVARFALTALSDAGKPANDTVPLPAGAPYGRVAVDTATCTLCLACVSACPAQALRDRADKPQLRFVETACVQCGLCATTCPEKAIRLEPRWSLRPDAAVPVVLHEDEPALCVSCGKPFAAAGVLRAVQRKLGGTHRMFDTDERQALLFMCDTCRLTELSKGGADPFAIASPRRVRTTDDYLRAEREGRSIDDIIGEG